MTYCTDSNSLSLHVLAICASQLFRSLALTLSGHILLCFFLKKYLYIYVCLFIWLLWVLLQHVGSSVLTRG